MRTRTARRHRRLGRVLTTLHVSPRTVVTARRRRGRRAANRRRRTILSPHKGNSIGVVNGRGPKRPRRRHRGTNVCRRRRRPSVGNIRWVFRPYLLARYRRSLSVVTVSGIQALSPQRELTVISLPSKSAISPPPTPNSTPKDSCYTCPDPTTATITPTAATTVKRANTSKREPPHSTTWSGPKGRLRQLSTP